MRIRRRPRHTRRASRAAASEALIATYEGLDPHAWPTLADETEARPGPPAAAAEIPLSPGRASPKDDR